MPVSWRRGRGRRVGGRVRGRLDRSEFSIKITLTFKKRGQPFEMQEETTVLGGIRGGFTHVVPLRAPLCHEVRLPPGRHLTARDGGNRAGPRPHHPVETDFQGKKKGKMCENHLV